jgi:hypothetical protein
MAQALSNCGAQTNAATLSPLENQSHTSLAPRALTRGPLLEAVGSSQTNGERMMNNRPSVWSNPGTGMIERSSEAAAAVAAELLRAEAACDSCRMVGHDGSGRFDFVFLKNGQAVTVSIPGVPLEHLRFESGLNPFDFRRIYVDGNSWLWPYAVKWIRDLSEMPLPVPVQPEQLRERLERATRNAKAFAEQVGASGGCHVIGGESDLSLPYVRFGLQRSHKTAHVDMPPSDLRALMEAGPEVVRQGRSELTVRIGGQLVLCWVDAIDWERRWLHGEPLPMWWVTTR